MLGFALDAIALIVILLIVERDALDDFPLIIMAAALVWVSDLFIFTMIVEKVGVLFSFVIAFAVAVVILSFLFKLTLKRALIASGAFIAYKFAFALILYKFM